MVARSAGALRRRDGPPVRIHFRLCTWLGIAATLAACAAVTSGCASLSYPEDDPAAQAVDTGDTHVATAHDPDDWVRLSASGRDAMRVRDLAGAEENFVAALAETSVFPPYDSRVRTALGNCLRLAAAYQRQDRFEDAGRLVELVVQNAEAGRAAAFSSAASVTTEQARWEQARGRPEAAIRIYQTTLGLWEAESHRNADARLMVEHLLGNAYVDAGRAAEALPLLERVRDEVVRREGTDSPAAIVAHVDLAAALAATGDLQAAEESYLLAIEIGDRFEPDGLELAIVRNQVAWFYLEHDRNEEALPLAEQAVASLDAMEIDGAPLASALDTLALAETRLGRAGEAEQHFRRAIDARDQADPASRRELDSVLVHYAALLRSVGRDDEADRIEADLAREQAEAGAE